MDRGPVQLASPLLVDRPLVTEQRLDEITGRTGSENLGNYSSTKVGQLHGRRLTVHTSFAIAVTVVALGLMISSTPARANNISSDEQDVRKAVLASLKDPESAKFGSFARVKDKACINVNARNAFGGYTGDRAVLLAKSGGNWLVLSGDDMIDRLVPSYTACLVFINRE